VSGQSRCGHHTAAAGHRLCAPWWPCRAWVGRQQRPPPPCSSSAIPAAVWHSVVRSMSRCQGTLARLWHSVHGVHTSVRSAAVQATVDVRRTINCGDGIRTKLRALLLSVMLQVATCSSCALCCAAVKRPVLYAEPGIVAIIYWGTTAKAATMQMYCKCMPSALGIISRWIRTALTRSKHQTSSKKLRFFLLCSASNDRT
jgi:hypothetical protein